MPPSEEALEALAEDFTAGFREQPGPIRRVGIEAEFPVVTDDGRAGDIAPLWPALLEDSSFQPDYDDPETRSLVVAARRPGTALGAEVGRATLELSLGPYDDLWELKAGLDAVLEHTSAVARTRGLALLGFGIQPRTPPSAALMTPRRHYRALLHAAGRAWLPLTTTASSQLHVDIARPELVAAVNVMNLLSGPLIAFAANSSVYAGRAGRSLSGREALLAGLGEHRYGMTPRRLGSPLDLVGYLTEFPCHVLPRGATFLSVGIPFRRWLAGEAARRSRADLYRDFLWHEHYVWNSARARTQHSTIEVRPACQQPAGALLAPHALSLGWVESLSDVEHYFADALGPDPWPAMMRFRRRAIQDGLEAEAPALHMLAELLEIARRGLVSRNRKEEEFLDPIAARLEQGENPALQARDLFRRRGMQSLIRAVRIETP
ncbi:MAG: glutamate-cysteine ligase family protein [Anaerolineales bacterium]